MNEPNNVNLDAFWQNLIKAVNARAIPVECFKVERKIEPPQNHIDDPKSAWKICRLFFVPENIIKDLQLWLTRQGSHEILDQKLLRKQLVQQSYWIGGKHRKRFCGRVFSCWGIDLNLMPSIGYISVSAEHNKEESDHRNRHQGPLYQIIHRIGTRSPARVGVWLNESNVKKRQTRDVVVIVTNIQNETEVKPCIYLGDKKVSPVNGSQVDQILAQFLSQGFEMKCASNLTYVLLRNLEHT